MLTLMIIRTVEKIENCVPDCRKESMISSRSMDDIIKKVKNHNKAIAYAFFGEIRELDFCEIVWKTEDRALLFFGRNQKVLYVNGDASRESGYQKYLAWFNQNINYRNRNYIKNSLLYDGYGFVEYMEDFTWTQEKCNSECYQKYGELIAIVWSLSGRPVMPESVGLKDGMPVIKDILPLLDRKIDYRELPEADRISEWLRDQFMDLEVIDRIEQGYTVQKEFIENNRTDIETLIRLCF